MIRLETSKRTGIANAQDKEISHFELNWSKTLQKQYPRATFRTGVSACFNCHGFTFASRRTKITSANELKKILVDDSYESIELHDVMPGDIVLYHRSGDFNHSGIVVAFGKQDVHPTICSKWGNGPEVIHALRDCPSAYGPDFSFYRCQL